jgi:hypothetical protein
MVSCDGLYYPYINVRSLNWLKATLLCFPHVLRMVPREYLLRDLPEMREFSETEGAAGRPLLQAIDVLDPAYLGAQRSFLHRLNHDFECAPDLLIRKFSRDRAVSDYGEAGTWSFTIHVGKFSYDIVHFLQDRGLAWRAPLGPNGEDRLRERRREDWVALHPRLGQAFMSTIAAAVAKEHGCDVLTDSGKLHASLANKSVSAIYDELIGAETSEQLELDPHPVTTALQFVFMTKFDLEGLSAADIAKLSEDREGLYALKEAIKPVLQEFPSWAGDRRRFDLLKEVSDTIVKEWETKRASFSNLARRVFRLDTLLNYDMPDYMATSAVAAAPLGSTTFTVLAGAAGLAVGVLMQSVAHHRTLSQNPYRFLSTLESGGAKFISSG